MIKLSLYLALGLFFCCNAAEFGGRIIGGRESQPEDAITVTIYSVPSIGMNEAFLTTGVAITAKLVLGAAQAVETILDGENIVFAAHLIGFDSILVDRQTRSVVSRVVVHDEYDPNTLQYNVAAFHLHDDVINHFVHLDFVGNIPIPDAVKVLGYGAPNAVAEFSDQLLTTLAFRSTDCSPVLNSLVYRDTNHCIRTDLPLAQGDQGGPITNSWLTPDNMTLFCLVSYWTRSDPNIVVLTNLKHPNIARFIEDQFED